MKRANKQFQGRAFSRHSEKQRRSVSRRRLLVEGLEERQLLAVSALGPSGGADTPERTVTLARNIGTVPAFEMLDNGRNDSFTQAQFVPLGTGRGQEDTIDISGEISRADAATRTPEDVDYYAVDLRAGDILDIGVVGAVGAVDVFFSPGKVWFGAERDASLGGTAYPFESPLQTAGDVTIAQTVPQSGRYFIRVAGAGAAEGIYTLGLRVYRPVLESAPVGTMQTLFLDFDGESYLRSELDPNDAGIARLSPLSSFLFDWGLRPEDEDEIIDKIVAVVEENFNGDIPIKGNNGSFAATGTPGEFGLRILNSRDHDDPFGLDPFTSRVIVGGTMIEAGVETIGLASSIDVGNFDTSETGFVLLDLIEELIVPIERTASFTVMDTISTFLGNVVTHEAGHYFGAWHQDNSNSLVSVMDQGGDIPGFTGTGPDEIFGTADDNDVDFTKDVFTPNEGVAFGPEDTINAMAFNLSTGASGGFVTGTVFNDLNRNRSQGSNEPGISGVVVFADLNGNGVIDTIEPRTTTDASGNYQLTVAPGSVTVRTLPPSGFAPTTASSRSVNVSLNQTVDADFGFVRVVPDATGFKWNDLNGDGIRDASEPGIEGVYIYADLDGDGRIDLGEPRGVTQDDGSYSINFPGAGTYTLREVVEPGFVQTFPAEGFHVVTFDGATLSDNFNFGNQSIVDYGDAPAPYRTLAENNGASHGIIAGFGLGALTDAEANGQPTTAASGDDNNGEDDEDGIVVRSPLSPGSTTNTFEVTVRNTTGAISYLQGWIDLNQDGDWDDEGERVIADRQFVGSETRNIEFALPESAELGDTYARFRLSSSPGTEPTGFVTGGEVEDYRFTLTATPELANNDTFDIPRGSGTVELDLLANDFDPDFNPLSIESVDTTGTRGAVVIATDGRSVFYTPRGATLGRDSFTYTVTTETGSRTATARVDLNLIFESVEPIAVDDSFHLSPSSTGVYTLDVLPNDVPSVVGDSQIITHSNPANGFVSIIDGGQRLRYSPAAGFSGTDQFTYTISDSDNQQSTATVTVHLLPGAEEDDRAAFTVQTLANDGVTPIQAVETGQLFKVRVLVDDIRAGVSIFDQGLGSAYLDLLYSDGLVTPVFRADDSLDITYGELFQSIKTADADTPGIINEVGATQEIAVQPPPPHNFSEPEELFTLTLRAIAPGVAEFVADPAESPISDTVLLNETEDELTPSEIRFGRRQLSIVPVGTDFTFAVDDSYPDGRDSRGNPITSASNASLDVLANDRPTGGTEIVSIGAVANGTASVSDSGTPNDPTDDRISYRPNAGFDGIEQFSYTIRSADGIQSTAQVTVTVGNAAADDLVGIELNLLDSAGNAVTEVTVGESFQLQIMVDDLREPAFGEARGVFAAYMDILYNSQLAEVTDTTGTRFGFDVDFGDKFDENTAVGDALIPGLINEFGTFQSTSQGSGDPLDVDPVEFATISFVALAPGNLRLVADPADVSPFQDTLLFEPPNVVPIGRIRYDVATLTIRSNGSGEGEVELQNQTNRMDVNDDGQVSPIDALLVLNRLNRSGGEGEATSTGTKYFWDVNGDKIVSPIDALQVINYLNRATSTMALGEGEAAPLVGSESSADDSQSDLEATDTFFSSLGSSSTTSPVVEGSSGTTNRLLGGSIPTAEDDDEKDEDDVLKLLAEGSNLA